MSLARLTSSQLAPGQLPDTGTQLHAMSLTDLLAACSYQAGQQVCLTYGAHDNLTLLGETGADVLRASVKHMQLTCTLPAEHYGFCLPENPHNKARLPADTFQLPGLQDALRPADVWLHPCGTPCWQLLHQLRLLTASPAERR